MKGDDEIAQQIKKLAQEEGIPIIENVPLAHARSRSACASVA